MIVQNSDVWERLSLNDDQINNLKFVLQLEGKACEGVFEWETFLKKGLNIDFIGNNADPSFDIDDP